ncbi:MAG TPA: LytTR family DNA-binding domain-containing protein, partial [Tenuifilaceae bacterium]|nr:LytTR family DNA-binding domain-containing protein [Tenuifilaceae bacterium]
IAIDDEPLALKQIESYIDKTPFLEKIAICESAMQALQVLQEQPVDLMFVDINMPDLSGMDFVKSIDNPPKIIFTTAYSEYAVEGFRVDAIDYLLKPISYPDFLRSANKAKSWFDNQTEKDVQVDSNEQFLYIKSEYKILRINHSDIKYIEGMREYVKIHLVNQKPVMSLISMKKLEEFLPEAKFMRVHRSYIVNLDKITTIERSRIIFDGDVYIPVSEQYNQRFQEYLNKNFLM